MNFHLKPVVTHTISSLQALRRPSYLPLPLFSPTRRGPSTSVRLPPLPRRGSDTRGAVGTTEPRPLPVGRGGLAADTEDHEVRGEPVVVCKFQVSRTKEFRGIEVGQYRRGLLPDETLRPTRTRGTGDAPRGFPGTVPRPGLDPTSPCLDGGGGLRTTLKDTSEVPGDFTFRHLSLRREGDPFFRKSLVSVHAHRVLEEVTTRFTSGVPLFGWFVASALP